MKQEETKLASDVTVIGSGGGLAAAAAAAQSGAKVIVLEKRKVFGGNTALARALLAAESPVQKRLRIDASKEALFKASMSFAHWRINPEIVRAFLGKSGDTIAWLESMGVRFQDVPNGYYNQMPRVYHLPEGFGAAVISSLLERCGKSEVRLLKEISAKKILLGKKGQVTGVLAESGGREMTISAKCVVVATGGYSGNKKLLKEYCPHYIEDTHVHGIPHMGDGIIMAGVAGAAFEGLGNLLCMGPFFTGSLQVAVISVESNTVWVNKRGERFADESSYVPSETANALSRQPGQISYTLFDDDVRRSFIEEGLIKGHHRLYPPGSRIPEFDKHLQKEMKDGRAIAGKSWKEIAQWIGADPKELERNIAIYNDSCDHGYDGLFYKDRRYLQPLRKPPFYALICHQAFHGTTGGIKINHRMEVLGKNDKPIPGLFAAGNDTGGWTGETYNYTLTGMAFAFAINSGRIAGENAAIYASGKP